MQLGLYLDSELPPSPSIGGMPCQSLHTIQPHSPRPGDFALTIHRGPSYAITIPHNLKPDLLALGGVLARASVGFHPAPSLTIPMVGRGRLCSPAHPLFVPSRAAQEQIPIPRARRERHANPRS